MANEDVKKNQLQRQEFSAVQDIAEAETAGAASAAEAKAMTEARFIMALKFPRSWEQVRLDLVKECNRPSFAKDPSAYYIKPIGKGVEGLGIRFAEVAVRCMKNIVADSFTVFENDQRRVIKVFALDLESNTSHSKTVTITKTVERSKPADDGAYISVRTNSQGRLTYTVPANDDDLLNKENSNVSKTLRTQVLRLVPGWLQEECKNIILRVREDESAKDPDADKRQIIDAFASLNIRVTDLENDYLEHPIDQCSPAELANLRGLYGAIKDGELTWQTVVENREEMRKVRGREKNEKKEAKGNEAVKEAVKREASEAPKAEIKEAKTEPKAEPVKKEVKEKAAQVEKTREVKEEVKPVEATKAPEVITPEVVEPESAMVTEPEEDDLGLPPEEEEATSTGSSIADFTKETERLKLTPDTITKLFGAPANELPSAILDAAVETLANSSYCVRGILFPLDLTGGEKPTAEQLQTLKDEAKKLKVSPEKTAKLWLKTDLEALNGESVARIVAAMRTYQK